MSVIWTYNDEPVTFGGRVATFGGPPLTLYGNSAVLEGPWESETEFGSGADEQIALITAGSFTLTETTNFIAMSGGVRINNGSTGNVEYLLWTASSGTPVTLVAITGNIAVPVTTGTPVLVVADVSGIAEFQNIEPGEYTLSIQATTEGIRLGSTTPNDETPFYQKGDNTPTVGNSWIADGGNRSTPVIWIEGTPAVGLTSNLTGDLTFDLTTNLTG